MEVVVYGTICSEGRERETAYRLLSLALQRELGIDTLPEIEREPGGKPYFPEHRDLHFNISHSHGAAVCALHDSPVGIDVERVRRAPPRLSQGQDDTAFFRSWTAKEATIKRAGLGVGALLKPVEIVPECRTLEEFLPGWIVTVCPSECDEIRMMTVDAAELT